jgi:hypothetical protein
MRRFVNWALIAGCFLALTLSACNLVDKGEDMTVTVTFNIADGSANDLGCDAVVDEFTTAEFQAGVLTDLVVADNLLSLESGNPNLAGTMTASDAPSPNEASATTEQGYAPAWKAFDGNTGDGWRSTGTGVETLYYNFGDGNDCTITSYKIIAPYSNSPPYEWNFRGWNGSEWVVLDYRKQVIPSTPEVFEIDGPHTAYSYYSLEVLQTRSALYWCDVYELELYAGEAYASSGTLVSPAYDVSAYGATEPDLKIAWKGNVPENTSVTIETGTSDSDSVDPATWYEQTNHSSITDLPADLTGKYLYYRVTLATTDTTATPTLDWVVVYDAADSPYAAARVDFNDEIKTVPGTGTVDFTGVPESSTLDYTVYTLTLSDTTLEPETAGSVTTVSSAVTENVEVSEMAITLDSNLPAVVAGDSYGRYGHMDGTLPDLECAATMGNSRSIRTGDYPFTDSATLPVIELDASFDHHASMDADLPTLECEARTGSRASGKLPYMEATATGSISVTARLDKKLPVMSLAATMGARLDKKLPAVTLEAEMSTPVLMRLDKKIPVPDLDATISGASGSLNKILFFPKLEATASTPNTATLDGKIPTITSTATAKSGAIMTLDATLPEVRAEAESNSAVINLDAYLPTVTSGVASGSDYGGTGSTMSGDRFDGTLLRYSRWA